MALTPSKMLALGTVAVDFSLPDAKGTICNLFDYVQDQPFLLMFICNHCPYVKHVASELALLGRDAAALGVAVLAINSNDAERYPDDSPAAMLQEIRERGYSFPYLIDASQAVARAYDAACTPDFYLFDGQKRLVYRGQLDDSRPGNGIPVSGADLRAAINAVAARQSVPLAQKPSIGCNIKWKADASVR